MRFEKDMLYLLYTDHTLIMASLNDILVAVSRSPTQAMISKILTLSTWSWQGRMSSASVLLAASPPKSNNNHPWMGYSVSLHYLDRVFAFFWHRYTLTHLVQNDSTRLWAASLAQSRRYLRKVIVLVHVRVEVHVSYMLNWDMLSGSWILIVCPRAYSKFPRIRNSKYTILEMLIYWL